MGAIELGRRIRCEREAAELSYRDVRERSGLALGHLQRLEQGRVAHPRPDTLRALAGALGVDYRELLREAGIL